MTRRKIKVTTKSQATIHKVVRKFLGAEAEKEIEWNIVKGIVIVDASRKVRNPVRFLTSQVKFNLDAVKLVKESRKDLR